MAALQKERNTVEIANGAKTLSLPVKGATTIYQGSLVALDANGYAPGKESRKYYGGRSCRGNCSEYRIGRRAGDSCFPWRVRL